MEKKNAAAVLKAVHILAVTSCSGGLSAMLLLLFHEPASATATAALRLFSAQVTWGGLVLFVSSSLFSLFFDWGILRFRWIALKWLLLAGVTAVSWGVLGPALSGLAAAADAGLTSDAARTVFTGKLAAARGAAFGMSAALIAAIGLSVLKPRLGHVRPGVTRAERIVSGAFLGLALFGAASFAFSELSLGPVRALPIADLRPDGLPDGVYPGSFAVGSYAYSVKVRVAGGRIASIEAADGRTGEYVEWARGVFRRIIWRQSARVEAVAGATTTSKAYLKAVEAALFAAGARAP